MSYIYYLTDKGRANEPKNPAGKEVMDYCKDGHTPVNGDEVRQMCPGVPNPEGELDSLYKAGFLRRSSEEETNTFNWMSRNN